MNIEKEKLTVVGVGKNIRLDVVGECSRIELKIFRTSEEAYTFVQEQSKQGNDNYLLLVGYEIDQETGLNFTRYLVCLSKFGILQLPKFFMAATYSSVHSTLIEDVIFNYKGENATVSHYIPVDEEHHLAIARQLILTGEDAYDIYVMKKETYVKGLVEPIILLSTDDGSGNREDNVDD